MVQMAWAAPLKAGDLVLILLEAPVWMKVPPESTYIVSDVGDLKLPLLRQEIPATGLTTFSLIDRVNEAYKNSPIRPAPTVINIYPVIPPTNPLPQMTALGAVHNSGEFPLREGMTLMRAINRAGGFKESAGTRRVKLIRAKQETIYDLTKINPDGSNNPVLIDGDTIIVPAYWTGAEMRGSLKPGDSVPLVVTGLSDLDSITTTYRVSDNGQIKMPQLEKEIEAAGIAVDSLILLINHSYRTAGIVGVTVSAPKPDEPKGKFKLRQGLGNAEEFPLRAGMTLLAAINRAGGMDEKVRKIKLLRGGNELIFDVRKLNSDGPNNPILMDGDEIVVPQG